MSLGDETAGYDELTGGDNGGETSTGAAQVSPVAVPELKSLLSLAVGAAVIASLYFGKEVLVPITLAVMLTFVLSPVVSFLQRWHVWRAPAVIMTVLAAFALIGVVGTLIGTQAASLTADAPRYASTIEAKVHSVQGFALAKVGALTRAFGGSAPPPSAHGTAQATSPGIGRASGGSGGSRPPVLVEMAKDQNTPLSVAKAIIAPILSPLETTLIVVIVAIFFLLQREDLRDRFIRLFLHRTTLALDDVGKRLSHYFLSQLSVNAGFGLVIGLGLWAIGIPSPAMWGILASLLRFVPYIGSTLAAVAPIALGAALDPGWAMAIYVGLLFVTVELLTGYVVEPMLYGHSTGLSPVSVIVAAIFWTWLWGPIGLILSTPLTLCLVVMGRHVRSLEFFDVLLGDRPALTAVESFYQRILSNDPDEALVQAEALLAENALLDYYDDVVVKGLRLATEDRDRGTIDDIRLAKMTHSVSTVVDEIGRQGIEAEPPRSTGEGSIACVAGRGPFDPVANDMVAQLFEQGGWSVRILPQAAVTRETIGELNLIGVDVVAITSTAMTGSHAQLRYLVRRIRQRLPAARIVVGLWPEREGVNGASGGRQMIEADAFATSLRDVIERTIGRSKGHALVTLSSSMTVSSVSRKSATRASIPSQGSRRMLFHHIAAKAWTSYPARC